MRRKNIYVVHITNPVESAKDSDKREGCDKTITCALKRKILHLRAARDLQGERAIDNSFRCCNSANIHPNTRGMNVPEEKFLDMFESAFEGITITRTFGEDILNGGGCQTKVALKKQVAEFKRSLKELEAKEDRTKAL